MGRGTWSMRRKVLAVSTASALLVSGFSMIRTTPAGANHTCNGKSTTIDGTNNADVIEGTAANNVIGARMETTLFADTTVLMISVGKVGTNST
jgi:hypothetical protein